MHGGKKAATTLEVGAHKGYTQKGIVRRKYFCYLLEAFFRGWWPELGAKLYAVRVVNTKIIFHFSVEAHTHISPLFVQMIYTEDDDFFSSRYLEHFLYVLHIFLLALSIRTFTCRMEAFDFGCFERRWGGMENLSVEFFMAAIKLLKCFK